MPTRPPAHRAFSYGPSKPRPDAVQRLRGRPHARRLARLKQAAPLCVVCEREGVVVVAVEWDHVVPLWRGGLDHESNMQGLCREHHLLKSRAEAAERNSARGYRVKLRPQLDAPL